MRRVTIEDIAIDSAENIYELVRDGDLHGAARDLREAYQLDLTDHERQLWIDALIAHLTYRLGGERVGALLRAGSAAPAACA